MSSRVTIKDLARELKVNISTISRALQNHPDISKPMREKVQKLAQKLGYVPNHLAVQLRKKETKIIALIMPEITMFFSTSLVKTIEEIAYQNGYHIVVLHSQDKLQREKENIDFCLRNSVDGVLISLSNETTDIEHIAELLYANIPTVIYDRIITPALIHQVAIDDRTAAKNGVVDLIKNLPKNTLHNAMIWGFFGNQNLSITQNRHNGFLDAIKNFKIKNYQSFFETEHKMTMHILDEIWNKKTPHLPQAVFCMTDDILSHFFFTLQKKDPANIKKIHLMCMSDGFFPELFYPKIPYVFTSGKKMGQQAIQTLLSLIKNKSLLQSSSITYVDTQLIK